VEVGQTDRRTDGRAGGQARYVLRLIRTAAEQNCFLWVGPKCYLVAARLTDSEIIESNGSSLSLVVNDDSIAVSCVASNSVRGFRGKATAIVYAIRPLRTTHLFTLFIFIFWVYLIIEFNLLCGHPNKSNHSDMQTHW